MEISSVFPPECLLFDLGPCDSETAMIGALVGRVLAESASDEAERVAQTVTRYAASSGDNAIACYLGTYEALHHPTGCMACLSGGGTCPAAVDGALAVALVLGPRRQKASLVKLCAEILRLGAAPQARTVLAESSDAEACRRFVDEWFAGYEADLCAGDVMRPSHIFLTEDTPLLEVVRRMLQYNLEAIGIVDGRRRLVGEVTSDILFRMGMPEFFTQLKSVAFVGAMDPFEKYFEKEGGLMARDVMSREFAAVSESTPILEIIFQLAVKRHWKVFVVREDGELIGVIDRMRVLEKVLSP